MKSRPRTVYEAINSIYDGLSQKDRDFIISHSSHEVHHSIGRYIRNDMGLWGGNTDIINNFKQKYNLFGHGDDISGLILEGVWHRVNNNGDLINLDAALNATAERFRRHWIAYNIDTQTGEEVKRTKKSRKHRTTIRVDKVDDRLLTKEL